MRPNHDLHNHTIHCDHARENATVKNLIFKAADLQLECLGISEHVRFSEEAENIENIKRDLKEIEIPENFPRILLGVELDPDPIYMDGRFVADIENLDYTMMSIHRMPQIGIGVWKYKKLEHTNKELEKMGHLWMEFLEACIEYSSFNILGHPVRFPIELNLFDIKNDIVFLRVVDILKKLADKKTAFEINDKLAGILMNSGYMEIYADLIKELKKYGVKFCRGSDSHSLGKVGSWNNAQCLVSLSGITDEDWIKPEEWFA